jgi:hypothetical protein
MNKLYKFVVQCDVYLMADSDDQAMERVKEASIKYNAFLTHKYHPASLESVDDSDRPKYPLYAGKGCQSIGKLASEG